MKTYAYARVSSKDQNLSRQLEAFRNYGVEEQNIYSDKKSGKNFERKGYMKLLRKLRKGDLLIIKSIDRLGRNYKMITDEWNNIVNNIGADILVLDMPILDTRSSDSSLIGKFISDIVLQILSFVAENERDNIRARQAEDIALAKARGVKFGRPAVKYSKNFLSALEKLKNNEITLKEALQFSGMKQSNFYYHASKLGITFRKEKSAEKQMIDDGCITVLNENGQQKE